MDKHRLLHIPGRAEQTDKAGQIMPIHGPQIGQAHIFKHCGRKQKTLQPVFQLAAGNIDPLAPGKLLHNLPVPALGVKIIFTGTDPGQVPGQASLAFPDGHFIIVQDNNHGLMADGSVIQALKGHAAGGGTISHQGNHMVVLPQQRPGPSHAQGNGNGAGSMTGNEGVRRALRGFGEAGQTAKLPQMRKIRPAAGQQLMHIRLMTNVKNQAVDHCIKNSLNGNGEFHRA